MQPSSSCVAKPPPQLVRVERLDTGDVELCIVTHASATAMQISRERAWPLGTRVALSPPEPSADDRPVAAVVVGCGRSNAGALVLDLSFSASRARNVRPTQGAGEPIDRLLVTAAKGKACFEKAYGHPMLVELGDEATTSDAMALLQSPGAFVRAHRVMAADGLSSVIVVGRDRRCDVVVPHRSISRRHLVLEPRWQDGEFLVTDEGSNNGSVLNGIVMRAQTLHRMKAPSLLQLGGVKLLFASSSQLFLSLRGVQQRRGRHE